MNLESEPWFAGELSRDRAEDRLISFPAGCFLVRKGARGFAISLRFFREGDKLDVFHIQIYSSVDPVMDAAGSKVGEMKPVFWVEEGAKFSSVLEMINYYMANPNAFFDNLEGAKQEHAGYKLSPCSTVPEKTYDGRM
jgi:hypothetical protein